MLTHKAELALYEQLQQTQCAIDDFLRQENYLAALKALHPLVKTLDTFFVEVKVMAEAKTEQNNRLALLAQTQTLFKRVCDLTLLI